MKLKKAVTTQSREPKIIAEDDLHYSCSFLPNVRFCIRVKDGKKHDYLLYFSEKEARKLRDNLNSSLARIEEINKEKAL